MVIVDWVALSLLIARLFVELRLVRLQSPKIERVCRCRLRRCCCCCCFGNVGVASGPSREFVPFPMEREPRDENGNDRHRSISMDWDIEKRESQEEVVVEVVMVRTTVPPLSFSHKQHFAAKEKGCCCWLMILLLSQRIDCSSSSC